jgi:hypothetical protein
LSDLEPLDVSVVTTGVEAVAQQYKDVGSLVREQVRREVRQIGAEVVQGGRARAPHRHGDLQASIRERLVETDTSMTETVRPWGRYGSFVGRLMEFGVVLHGFLRNRNLGSKRHRAERVREGRSAGQYRIAPKFFMRDSIAAVRSQIDSRLQAAAARGVQGVK